MAVFQVPRYCVQITIDDNKYKENIVDEGFNTDSITAIEIKLREVAAILNRSKE